MIRGFALETFRPRSGVVKQVSLTCLVESKVSKGGGDGKEEWIEMVEKDDLGNRVWKGECYYVTRFFFISTAWGFRCGNSALGWMYVRKDANIRVF